MQNNGLEKYTVSYGVSLAITSLLSAFLVVFKELNEPLLNFMKRVTIHHWVTHGAFDLIVFVVLGWLLAQVNGGAGLKISTKTFVTVLVGAVVVSGLIIAGFYLIEG
jgi:hypothetical protein